MRLLPIENMFSLVQLWRPSMVVILLLYSVRSVRFTNLSMPSIVVILLKDRSSHFRFVKWSMHYIFSMMLLSSCNFYRRVNASRYCILRMSGYCQCTEKWEWENFDFSEIDLGFFGYNFVLAEIVSDSFPWWGSKYLSMS